MERNPVVECNKVRQKYCPNLFRDFAATKDPRNLSYTEYSNGELLGTVYYKGIAGIVSMQSMTYEFNRESVVGNLYRFMGREGKEYLPHAVTVNEYFERLGPEELQGVLQRQVYGLIRSKAFYGARFRKRWLVIVDGTQTYSGSRKLNDGCLERHYNKGTAEETVNYHCDVLEAKIVLGEGLIVSICSEFIENNGEDAERQSQMSEEERKQDCETKAFKRLAEKLHGAFPRLPITLLADSLYASGPVMDTCRGKGWDITHACSWDSNALKNHYLMTQIADMVKQLYEWFFLKRNGIKKGQKNISSELLASFDRQLTAEDIPIADAEGKAFS